MKGTKGGYHPDARLEATRDELVMEALVGANDPRAEIRERAFQEIARLARKYQDLLEHVLRGGPGASGAFAGA